MLKGPGRIFLYAVCVLLLFFTYTGEYLSPKIEHSKCYCPNCLRIWGEPRVKFSGDPQKKYAVARGWVKFGLRYVHE